MEVVTSNVNTVSMKILALYAIVRIHKYKQKFNFAKEMRVLKFRYTCINLFSFLIL